MQREILENHPASNIRVYAVWFDTLPGDARQKWDAGLMSDPRVTQLWDDNKSAGRFFAEQEGFKFGSIAYDIYYLYGPEANWDVKPSPLVSSGYTVITKRNQLLEDITLLLAS